MAIGGNVPDENLVPGFTVQNAGGGVNYSAAYVPVVGDVTTNSQANAGFPFPPGAANVGSENSGSYAKSVLTNASYSVSQVGAAAGTNPTAVGAAITIPTGGVTATVLSALSLVLTNLDSGTVTYTIGGSGSISVTTAGEVIPAGAAVTATAGVVFVTAAA